MQTVHRSAERGHARHGWLTSFHSFSFADYHDPARMGWGNLRVINEDFVAAHRGFGMHPHRDMEIITYVLEGALTHQDSLGNTAVIRPGEIQRMTAGTGVRHSEINSADAPVHLLQIWIFPDTQGLAPGYEQVRLDETALRGRLACIAAPNAPHAQAVSLHANARVFAGRFHEGEQDHLDLPAGRMAWVQVARGEITVNGEPLQAGDALALSDETRITLSEGHQAEILVFDLAPF